jgi:hypothetical protein
MDKQTNAREIQYSGGHIPGRAEIDRLLKSVSRPFLIANERELSVLRRGLTKDGWKRSLYYQEPDFGQTFLSGEGLRALAKHWQTADIVVPSPGSSCEDFFCDDGTMLVLPSDGSSNYTCPACKKNYHGQKYNAAARWMQHQLLANAALAMGLVFQLEHTPQSADKAAELLLKCAEAYPKSQAETGMLAQLIDEAAWIIPLAQAYDLVYHTKLFSNDGRRYVEEGLFRSTAKRLATEEISGSCGAWQLSAVGLIGCVLRDTELLNWALEKFILQINEQVDEQGLFKEPVKICQRSALAAYMNLAEACSRIGIDLYNYTTESGSGIKQMLLKPLSYLYPSLEIPAVGACTFNSPLAFGLYEIAYRRWGEESLGWLMTRGYGLSKKLGSDAQLLARKQHPRSSLYSLLFGRDLPTRARRPRIGSTAYSSPGLCVLRNDTETMLTLDYGESNASQHHGELGVTLFANGRMLVAEYGTPGEGARIADYYKGTSAHNTVVTDGASGCTTKPCLRQFRPGSYLQIAEASADKPQMNVEHTRRAVLAGDVVLVQDFLKSDSKHVYDWLMRAEGQLTGIDATTPTQTVSEHFSDACTLGIGKGFDVAWQLESAGLVTRFAASDMCELIVAQCPAETGCRRVPLVDLRMSAKSACYTSLLAPFAGIRPKVEQTGNLFKVISGSAIDWIYAGETSGKAHEASDIETDGLIAAVREIDGKMVSCGIYCGSYIRLRGEMLFEASERLDWAEVKIDARNPILSFEGEGAVALKLKCNSRSLHVNGNRIAALTQDGIASIKLSASLTDR